MEIVAEEGVQNLTMARLAKRIGITDGALYKHFDSKKAIIMAMADQTQRAFFTFIVPEAAHYDDPFEKLRHILRLHLEFLEQHKGMPRILFSDFVHVGDTDTKRIMRNAISNYLDLVRGILHRAIQEGRVRRDLDVDAAATAFLGLVQGCMIVWSLSDFAFPLAERHAALWNVFAESLRNVHDQAEISEGGACDESMKR